MKALSIASFIAIALAGTACSQSETSGDAEPAPEQETVQTADDVGGSFNLGLPSDLESAGTSSNGGFNLDLPNTEASSTDGFNLGTDIQASGGLSDVPEIDTSVVEEEPDVTPDVEVDDEPVIRLD